MAKKLKFILLSVLTGALFFLFLTKLSDYDTWFHLAAGRKILTSFAIPQFDIFSHTAYGAAWHLIAWGFDAFIYGCYQLIGPMGLSILWAVFGILLGFIIFLRCEKEKDFLLPLILTAPILIAINYRWVMRPEVMGYIFFSVFLYLIEKKGLSTRKLLLYIFINQVLWVNFHLSSMNAFLVAGALGVEAVFKRDEPRIKKLGALFGVIFAGSLINPYGIEHILYAVKTFFASHIETSLAREMMPMGSDTLFSFVGIFFILSIAGMIFLFRKRKYGFMACGIVFFLLSIKSTRFLNFYFVFIAPFFIDVAAKLALPTRSMGTYEIGRASSAATCQVGRASSAATAWGGVARKLALPVRHRAILAYILCAFSFLGVRDFYERGIGLDIFNIPINGAEFILKNGLQKTGNMYNTLNFGGYIDWKFPEKSVYIDGRLDMFINTGIYREYLSLINSPELWDDVVKKRNITYGIVRYPHIGLDGRIYNNTERLFPYEKWALMYFDETAIVYVRRDAVDTQEFQKFIRESEYHYINPQNLDPSYMYGPHYLMELQRNVAESPMNYRAHFYIAYIYTMLGPEHYQKAREELAKSLKINRHFKQAKKILDMFRL